jgi:hypothetical protein
VSNSDYMELEIEVEKIAYHLETLCQTWSKLARARSNLTYQPVKYLVEFQTLLNSLNSNVTVKQLEQSLFKLNWLITSKSGFSEPNWRSTVLSLTPSTMDSFIGVNLLKNYYKYVKYDFVSYKLFTRQLQLIQISAIIMHLINSILVYYRESITLSTITAPVTAAGSGGSNNGSLFDTPLLSFNFSADKYRPISWSANHVTLYNVQSNSGKSTDELMKKSSNLSRASSMRRTTGVGVTTTTTTNAPQICFASKEDHIRHVKYEMFLTELKEFLRISTQRLNIQSSLANRTGYFYIVNQSTGLVLQAVDFTSEFTLKEQIENNQKRIQSSSIKAGSGGTSAGGSVKSTSMVKGPRFYLMPKAATGAATAAAVSPTAAKTASNTNVSSSLAVETANDEQLWYYYLINGCVANKIIRSGHCMAASSLNAKSPVTFWPNVKTTNCSWYFNHNDQTIVSGLSDELVLDYVFIDEAPNQRYAVVIDTKVQNKASQKWSFEFN